MKLKLAPVPARSEDVPEYLNRELRRMNEQHGTYDLNPVSPAALGLGNNNDVRLGNNTRYARMTTNAGGSTITGIVAVDDRLPLYLVNLGPAVLTLAHQSASSAAANRFALASGTNSAIAVDGCAILFYDSVTARWRQLSRMA